MCNLHGPFKSLWHIKPWFIDCQVRSIWVWNRRFEILEKQTKRKQTVRVSKTFSERERITTCVPEGSLLGPLLFNVFLNDLFLFITNSSLSNDMDDNTSTLSEIIWKRSRIIYETVLIRCINGFTKTSWCLMQENVISFVWEQHRKRNILIQ